jgi:hypothetical protein
MIASRVGMLAVVAACSNAKPTVSAQEPSPPPPAAVRAILRIDPEPGAKKFQGVWLVRDDGSKLVIDYRARQLWTWFADREVLVTGGCYEPFGQAIMAKHYRVERMRPAKAQPGVGPYLEIGPAELLRGEFAVVTAPPGSKLAGSSRVVFRTGGTTFGVEGERPGPEVTSARVRARKLLPDMSYRARESEHDVWIVSIHEPDYVEEPDREPTFPCD